MKNAYRFIACIFIAFLACSIVINLAMGDSAYSESEKRELTQLPEFNTQNVLSGKFTSEFDKYTSDQFFARDSWVRVKGMSQYLMGQRLLNGVYVTENRYMRKLMTDEKRLSDNIDAILKLSEKSDVPVTLLIAPEAVSVYQDELPRFASAGEHEKR